MQHHVALSFRMSVFWLRAGATLHEAIYFGGEVSSGSAAARGNASGSAAGPRGGGPPATGKMKSC